MTTVHPIFAPDKAPITCEQCGWGAAEFSDPTWDKSFGTARPLEICEKCAAGNIEREMYKVVH